MTELIAVPQQNQWLRLKSLVLDSVSSPKLSRSVGVEVLALGREGRRQH
jgi:hypothetical protein